MSSTPRIVRGNQVTIALPLERLVISSTGQVVEEYVPDPDDEIVVNVRERQTFRYVPTIEGNVATFVLGADVPCGVYGVEVLITKSDGTRLRSYRLSQIAIVENNERAGLGEGVEFGVDSVQLNAAAYIFAKGDKGDPFTYEDFTEEQLDDLADRIELTPAELAEIAEKVDLSGYVNGGAYDSQTKRILLTHDNVVVSSIDATAFIKDGMVSGVVVDNGYIVITFNTDAGKEDIRIPVSEVFDASLYYTKTESDSRFAGKPFKVTLSSREEGGETVWSANKTFAEIYAAYQAGRDIVAIYDGAEVALNEYIGSGGFVFTVHYGNMVQQVYISENGVGVTPLTFVDESNVATINSQLLTRGGNITLPTPADITKLQTDLANYCPIIEDVISTNNHFGGNVALDELVNGQLIILHLHKNIGAGHNYIDLTLSSGETISAVMWCENFMRGSVYVANNVAYASTLFHSGAYVVAAFEKLYNGTNSRWFVLGSPMPNIRQLTQTDLDRSATDPLLSSAKLLRDNFYLKSEVDNLCPIIEDTRTSQVATITGVAPFSELRDGQRIMLHLAFSMPTDAQLILTLANGEQTSAAYLYFTQMNLGLARGWNGSVRAGSYIQFTFNSNIGWVIIGQRDSHAVLVNITQAEIDTGSSTSTRLVTPKLLVDNFEKRTQLIEVDNQSAQVEQALESNKFYKFLNPVDELTLTLVAPTGYGDVMGIYAGKFTASSTWDSLVLPASVEEAAGNDTIAAGKIYEFNILDNVIMVKEI